MSETQREMHLKEWVDKLHDSHLAVREYKALLDLNAGLIKSLEEALEAESYFKATACPSDGWVKPAIDILEKAKSGG